MLSKKSMPLNCPQRKHHSAGDTSAPLTGTIVTSTMAARLSTTRAWLPRSLLTIRLRGSVLTRRISN
jgi:hypothetical protein